MSLALFATGRIVATPSALDSGLTQAELLMALRRHVMGDWGDLSAEDKRANDVALRIGERLLSAYDIRGIRLWIISEADRSSTTFLLPSDY